VQNARLQVAHERRHVAQSLTSSSKGHVAADLSSQRRYPRTRRTVHLDKDLFPALIWGDQSAWTIQVRLYGDHIGHAQHARVSGGRAFDRKRRHDGMTFEPEHVDQRNGSVGGVIERSWQHRWQEEHLRKLVARHPTTAFIPCDPPITSPIVTSREELPLDLGMRGGRLTNLNLCVECFLTPRNGHRAHASVHGLPSSCQRGATHGPYHRIVLCVQQRLDHHRAIGRWVIVMCGEAE
jgi:hypothetical protein